MVNDEELYRIIVERASDGICIIQDKLIKFINNYLSELAGYSVEEIRNTSFTDYLDPSEINKVSNKYILLTTGQEDSQRYDTVLIDKSDNPLDVEINAGRISFEGKPAILAFIRDISGRKRHEKALAESEANYRGLVENMLEGVYRTLPDGKILSANNALVTMLGYNSEQELCNTTSAQDLYSNQEERVLLTENLEKNGELRNVEFQIRCKNGREITVMENARAVYDVDGKIQYYEGVLTDISKRKEVENKYRLLSSIAEQSIEGMALVDLDGNILFINHAFADMHGYSVEELTNKNLSIFHTPEQLPSVIRANEKIKETGQFQGEIWHVRKSGEIFPTLMNNTLMYDKEGKPVSMIGTVLDITDYYNITNALRESEERYRTLQNNVPVAIFRTKSNGTFISGNPALAKMFGCNSVDEIIGTSISKYFPNLEILKELYRKLDREVTINDFEMKLIRPDLSNLWVSINIRAVFDDDNNNEIKYIDGIALDISGRKEAELKLLSALDRLNATLNTLPDLLFEIDSEGRIWDFRAPNHSLLYRSPDYFLGKDIDQVLPPEAVSIIQKAIKTAKRQGECHGVEYSLDMNDGTFWFELSISIKGKQKGESARFIAMARDITIRKKSNELLKKASEKLKNEQKELKEKNIALGQILRQIEDERQNYRSQLYLDIDKNIRPVIKRLKKIVKSDKQKEIESIESNLEAILAKDIDKYKSRYSQLTSRESEICSLIETGLSSKQISEKLSLSVLTISKHREQIRKKLRISNKNINLATYLRTHSKK